MLLHPSTSHSESPARRIGGKFCRPVLGLAALAVLGGSLSFSLFAGTDDRPAETPARSRVVRMIKVSKVTPAPSPAPTPYLTNLPHLVAVGPMGLRIKPVAGPRVRRPPLLPEPTPRPTVAPEATPAPDTANPPAKEPSDFSPDAPPTLLPIPPRTKTPPPEPEPTGARESVLTPGVRAEPDLKDAVIYFETPMGPHGSRVTVPAIVPMTSPGTAAPQPESRATYRQEKE